MKKKLAAAALVVILALITGATTLALTADQNAPCRTGDCTSRDVRAMDLFSPPGNRGAAQDAEFGANNVEDVLEHGLALANASPTHLAIRGTSQTGSTRCEWRGIARTTSQREEAIRFWLDLSDTDPLPSPQQTETQLTQELLEIQAAYPETVISNFRAIAHGGLSEDYLFLTCHLDQVVQEFILGSGSAGDSITVSYDRMDEARSYRMYQAAHAAGEFGDDTLRTEGEYRDYLAQKTSTMEMLLAILMEDRESVTFLAPMGDHNAIATETWLAVAQWDLQEDDSGTVHAVRYGTQDGDPEQTQTLANLKLRITTAAASDSHADNRIANASGLNTYYQEIGAYDDITPGDGSTNTFTPEQPPVPMDCASGTAFTTPEANRGLVHDCENLLDAETTLAGTATLNWDKDTALPSWTGITTSGVPERVTSISLPNSSLNGNIPAGLGNLFELTVLNLSGNSLTGTIPHELGWLHKLTELKLSGNSLTGCIPVSLKDVATNDLASLALPYCQPLPPQNLAAGTPGTTTVSLTWNSVTGASKYQIEQRPGIGTEWTTLDQDITTSTHTATDLACDTGHQFRVSAFGTGATYQAAWSEPSVPVTAQTNPCPPGFGAESYVFTIRDDLAPGTAVGTISAENADTYSITGGNQDGKFAVSNTGEITTAGALDYAATQEYNLTIQADNGQGETNTAEVQVTLTDADCHNGTAVQNPEDNPRMIRDCSALLAAQDTLAGTTVLNWNPNLAMDSWEGVRLDGDPKRVTTLILTSKDLGGSIPPVLGRLQDLTRIDIDDNQLSGPIPAELAQLAKLTHIYTDGNQLSGQIPTELAQLQQLQVLYLEDNDLTGPIPTELAGMERLRLLHLGDNQLSGNIPEELGTAPRLEELLLRDNLLTGPIPASLEDLNLERLDLSGNSLTRCIPAGLHNIPINDLGDLGLPDCP